MGNKNSRRIIYTQEQIEEQIKEAVRLDLADTPHTKIAVLMGVGYLTLKKRLREHARRRLMGIS